jgi:xanthosine utilization system XapX-like protein
MTWVKAVGTEFLGLFVDDGRFAIGILLWLIVAGFALKRLNLGAVLPPVILFAGLVGILVESAVRKAGKR